MSKFLSKKKFYFLCIGIYSMLFFTSCDPKVSDLIGNEFDMSDGYHVIEFKSETSYFIHQKPHNCGGSGTWSFNDGKVVLGPNDSNCESTRKFEGTYDISVFK